MQFPNYEPLKIEPAVLDFWAKNGIYQRAKEKGKDGKRFYYLDGPPYTSGRIHLGHAWGKALRDSLMRYKRMKGFNVWDRAGFDTHGLPTAHAVEAKFGIKNKDEIPNFGMQRYIEECEKFCEENKTIMIKDFKRIGIWMDFESPYVTFYNSYIEAEWWLVKKAHENNRLYEGEKVMHWCANCSTALAKHELEYQNVEDDSIFLKFKVKDAENEYLIIWTTTPWTIPYNLGVMVNPDEDYIKAKVDNEVWIVASKLAGVFIQGVADKQYKVLEEFKGTELEGLEYIHPLNEELKEVYYQLKEESPKVHTIVLSEEYVDTGSGSGLVHMAPGCGPEDYEVGYKNKIYPFNNLDENGVFPDKMGVFADWVAKRDDKKFIQYFKDHGFLIESTKVEHEYPHCWRCHKQVIFRLTKQWFFKVEDLKDEMRELNKEIFWQPDWAGNRQFDSWLTNLRDNSITRQRYWGCPVPIWKCDKCENYEVIGSAKELKEKSRMDIPKDLHIPYIDEIKIPCRCSGTMHRIADILDVWVDAGIASWACLDYPQREDLFKEWWYPDFILEGKDQIRGWFNLLFVASMISMRKPSFKAVYMHGFINDAYGRKFSKSLKNYVTPDEIIDKKGADVLRYYMIGAANPGLDLNYNHDDANLKYKNLMVLWNIHKFLLDLILTTGKNPKDLSAGIEERFSVEENFIFSRLHSTIKEVTELFEDYRLNEVPLRVEELFLDLSRTYIQMIRDKASIGDEAEKEVVLYAVYNVLIECLKLFAPVSPFITEQIYQNLKEQIKLEQESIHLFDWPDYNKKYINETLESEMGIANRIIQSISYAREKANISLRWPLRDATIITKDDSVITAVKELKGIILNQSNIKNIAVRDSMPEVKESVKADFSKLGPVFGNKIPRIIAAFSIESAESILESISKKGKYIMKVDGEEFEITKEHLIISRQVPQKFVESEFKAGFVYLNKDIDEELEAEGYSREIMRRIQSMRKKYGFEKTDSIILYIKTEPDSAEMLNRFKDLITQKCGVSKIKISELDPARKHQFASKESIKGTDFEIYFDKV